MSYDKITVVINTLTVKIKSINAWTQLHQK